jgi:hypothetical protein
MGYHTTFILGLSISKINDDDIEEFASVVKYLRYCDWDCEYDEHMFGKSFRGNQNVKLAAILEELPKILHKLEVYLVQYEPEDLYTYTINSKGYTRQSCFGEATFVDNPKVTIWIPELEAHDCLNVENNFTCMINDEYDIDPGVWVNEDKLELIIKKQDLDANEYAKLIKSIPDDVTKYVIWDYIMNHNPK